MALEKSGHPLGPSVHWCVWAGGNPCRGVGWHGKDTPAMEKQTLAKVRTLSDSRAVLAERFGTGHWCGRMAAPSPADKARVHKWKIRLQQLEQSESLCKWALQLLLQMPFCLYNMSLTNQEKYCKILSFWRSTHAAFLKPDC